MKRSFLFVLFISLFVTLCFSSCDLLGPGKSSTVDACDHNWRTCVTGGQINIDASGNQSVASACTVTKTCTKCNKVVGSNVNPSTGLCYEECTGGLTFYVDLPEDLSSMNIVVPQFVKIEDDAALEVVDVSESAFSDTLVRSVMLPESIATIGKKAFSGCYCLEEIELPESCADGLGTQLFLNCYALKTVVLPSDVTSLTAAFFSNCYVLENVSPVSVVNSGNAQAFTNCHVIIDKYGLNND